MAAAGAPKIKEDLKKGLKVGSGTFKAHLDGYDQSRLLKGKGEGARDEIFYFDSSGSLNAVRYRNWKIHFTIMEGDITQAYSKTPSWPIVINLRQDPCEKFAFESRMYLRWMADKLWTFVPAQQLVSNFLARPRNSRQARPQTASASTR